MTASDAEAWRTLRRAGGFRDNNRRQQANELRILMSLVGHR